MKKVCLNCNHEFESKRSDKQYCTSKCKSKAWRIHLATIGEHRTLVYPQTEIHSGRKLVFTKVEEGPIFHSIKLAKRIQEFWIYSHSMLWGTKDFSEEEQNTFKQYIAHYFEGSKNIDETFRELVERVVLEKRYILEKPYRFIAPPHEYFNPNFYNGLVGSSKWFNALQQQRNRTPEFGENLNIFSQAIWLFAEQKNLLDIIFYRQVFITLESYDLLQWYLNAVMHYQFLSY